MKNNVDTFHSRTSWKTSWTTEWCVKKLQKMTGFFEIYYFYSVFLQEIVGDIGFVNQWIDMSDYEVGKITSSFFLFFICQIVSNPRSTWTAATP